MLSGGLPTKQNLTSQIYPPRIWTYLETLLQLKKYISREGRLRQVERNASWFRVLFLDLALRLIPCPELSDERPV